MQLSSPQAYGNAGGQESFASRANTNYVPSRDKEATVFLVNRGSLSNAAYRQHLVSLSCGVPQFDGMECDQWYWRLPRILVGAFTGIRQGLTVLLVTEF